MKNNTEQNKVCLQLLGVSFIALFLELMIIRWVPATVNLIAYYANLILISSFLGIGLGALLERRKLKILNLFPYLLLANIIFFLLFAKRSPCQVFLSSTVIIQSLLILSISAQ
jgi:hypothetical protein